MYFHDEDEVKDELHDVILQHHSRVCEAATHITHPGEKRKEKLKLRGERVNTWHSSTR